MKKCPRALINYFLNRRLVYVTLFILVCTGNSYCQRKFKFIELPAQLQNSVLNTLQKKINYTAVQEKITFIDTVWVHDAKEKNISTLFNFFVYAYSDRDTMYVDVRCIASKIIISNNDLLSVKTFQNEYDKRLGRADTPGPKWTCYVTFAKLSYKCSDHTPHHSAISMKEMMKLKDKFHCKKIVPFIIDG